MCIIRINASDYMQVTTCSVCSAWACSHRQPWSPVKLCVASAGALLVCTIARHESSLRVQAVHNSRLSGPIFLRTCLPTTSSIPCLCVDRLVCTECHQKPPQAVTRVVNGKWLTRSLPVDSRSLPREKQRKSGWKMQTGRDTCAAKHTQLHVWGLLTACLSSLYFRAVGTCLLCAQYP